jgi:hypothetical protein
MSEFIDLNGNILMVPIGKSDAYGEATELRTMVELIFLHGEITYSLGEKTIDKHLDVKTFKVMISSERLYDLANKMIEMADRADQIGEKCSIEVDESDESQVEGDGPGEPPPNVP